ncbi:MAG: hypothetical protein JOS17DRAFT_775432 [Linnemannia elongata]|nr:MAG: hypothetical protein JOS17DRAFT_775432 [Linnemannia elongata]
MVQLNPLSLTPPPLEDLRVPSVKKSFVPQARQTAVLNSFDIWERKNDPSFWTSQRETLSLTQTIGELDVEGALVAKDLVRKSRIFIVVSKRSVQTEEKVAVQQ